MESPLSIHPYTIIGGGSPGTVHGKESIERAQFLYGLDENKRRFVDLETHRIFYARLFGGECRERANDELHNDKLSTRKLMFVQGLGGTHTNWLPQLEYFSRDPIFDIVTVDLRGVGYSDTPGGRWRTTDLASDLVGLCETLKWEKCHLIGFSLGGMTSLETCLQRPDLFKSVTLISTHAGGLLGTLLPPWGILPFIRTFANLGSPSSVDAGMELLHPTHFLDRDVEQKDMNEDLSKIATKCLGNNDRVTYRFKTAYELIMEARKHIEAGVEPVRLLGTLKQISAAITHHVGWDRLFFLRVSGISFLVISGMHDNLVNYYNAVMLSQALNAPLIMKDDAGHGVNLQHREEINEVIRNHIEKAEKKQVIEGRRLVTNKFKGFPPGQHPAVTALLSFVPGYLIAKRLTSSSNRRFLFIVVFISIILRLNHGPLFSKLQRQHF